MVCFGTTPRVHYAHEGIKAAVARGASPAVGGPNRPVGLLVMAITSVHDVQVLVAARALMSHVLDAA
jgi:hypothetical protein